MDDSPSAVDPSGPLPEVNNITRSVHVDPSDVDPSSPLLECTRCHVAKPVSTHPCASCNSPVVLKNQCPNASFSCTAVLVHGQVPQTHPEKCEYTHSPCPFVLCDFIGSYLELYSDDSDVHSDEVQLIECGMTTDISFPHPDRIIDMLIRKELAHGELLIVQRMDGFPPLDFVSYFLTCVSPKVPTMGNFSYKLSVAWLHADGSFGRSATLESYIKRVTSARKPLFDYLPVPASATGRCFVTLSNCQASVSERF